MQKNILNVKLMTLLEKEQFLIYLKKEMVK